MAVLFSAVVSPSKWCVFIGSRSDGAGCECRKPGPLLVCLVWPFFVTEEKCDAEGHILPIRKVVFNIFQPCVCCLSTFSYVFEAIMKSMVHVSSELSRLPF